MKKYPPGHREIVNQLLDGRFIIYPDALFAAIQENDEDYTEFFRESYGYHLNVDAELVYLTGDDSSEKRTRDFTLFLAVLCRELDYSRHNFRDLIELGSGFDIAETEQSLRQSPKWEILEKTSVASFETFIDSWHRKNVLKRTGTSFKFTKAVRVFFEFAVNVAHAKLKEQPAADNPISP